MILSNSSMASRVICFALSSDAQLFAGGLWDGTVKVVETATGNLVKTLTLTSSGSWANSVAFSWEDQLIAAGISNSTIQLWLKPRRGNQE